MKPSRSQHKARRNEHGSAIVVVLVLISIMVILVSTNLAFVGHLRREIKSIEKDHLQRLQTSQPRAGNPAKD